LRADGNLLLAPLVSRGIEKDNAASVHAGFLISYNSVRASVIRIVREQLLAFPDYSVVIAGTFLRFLFITVLYYCTCNTNERCLVFVSLACFGG